MTGALLLFATGLSIYAMRASFIVGAGRIELRPWARRALAFGPPAVLAALLSSIVFPAGPVSIEPRAVAVAGTAFVVSRRFGMLPAVSAGFVLLVGTAQL